MFRAFRSQVKYHFGELFLFYNHQSVRRTILNNHKYSGIPSTAPARCRRLFADYRRIFFLSILCLVQRIRHSRPCYVLKNFFRIQNFSLTFLGVLAYTIIGGCGVRCDGPLHLFYWNNIIQDFFTVCGIGNIKCCFPDGVFFILNICCPILPNEKFTI